MNLYVYSDESGVFDYINNKYFIFAGIILFSKEEKENLERKYRTIEKDIYKNNNYVGELKAKVLKYKEKRRLYNIFKNANKFCCIIKQEKILKNIYSDKKSKQRYLDYAFKISIKEAFKSMIKQNLIDENEIDNIIVYCDEHTTATNGKYELREALLNEFKRGTFNREWNIFYEPLFKNMKDVKLKYCNSEHTTLVRGADIIANKVYAIAVNENWEVLRNLENMNIKKLP
jgi:hypothetical protein